MSKLRTSWLVGSAYIPQKTINIDGSNYFFPEGFYYLRHPEPALSLIDTLKALLVSAAISGVDIVVLSNRKVRITFDVGATFTILWGDLYIKQLLGFTTEIGTEIYQIADQVSPLLWSPRKNETPTKAPLGCLGQKVRDTQFSTSPDSAYQFARTHHQQIINQFAWDTIPMDRFQTPDELGGEYTRFYDQVWCQAQKAWLYRKIVEDVDDEQPVIWTADPLGPYGFMPPNKSGMTLPFNRTRGLSGVDRMTDVTIDVIVVREWGGV